jgi:hypothetical protein
MISNELFTMKINILKLGALLSIAFLSNILFAQTGSSCADAMPIYPAPLGDCDNTANIPGPGSQFGGQWQCPDELCGDEPMVGTNTGMGLAEPSCAGTDIGQCAYWMEVNTGNGTSINIESFKVGTGNANTAENTKDYVVYSGTCGALVPISCNTIGGSSNVTITGLTANEVYYIMATPSGTSTSCEVNVCVTSTTPYVSTAGQDCGSATALTSGVSFPGVSNANASGGTAGGNTSICEPPAGSIENSTWYVWTAPLTWVPGADAYINISNQLCNSSAYGLQFSVYGAGEVCNGFATSDLCITSNTVATQYFDTWAANPGETFYIITDGFAGIACEFDIQVNDAPLPLPIRLGSFSADKTSSQVNFNWVTYSELNNDYYTIEKSIDGKIFKNIATVLGGGTTNETSYYTSLDPDPANGVNYYRLIQTDYNGTKSASDVIAVTFSYGNSDLNFFPNPIGDEDGKLSFYSDEVKSFNIEVSDLSGKLVLSKMVTSVKGQNTVDINLSSLEKGTYLVNIGGTADVLKLVRK